MEWGALVFRSISPAPCALLTFVLPQVPEDTNTKTGTQNSKMASNQATPNPPASSGCTRTGRGWGQLSAQFCVSAFLTMTHPDIPVLMIGFPVSPSVTIEHAVLGHPVRAAVPSLGCNGTDLLPIAKVDLKPLIMVTVGRRPAPGTWRR